MPRCTQIARKSREGAEDALRSGKRLVIIDRTNACRDQRKEWIEIAHRHGAKIVAVTLTSSRSACIERCLARKGHEGGLSDPKTIVRVVEKFARDLEFDPPTAKRGGEPFDFVVRLPPLSLGDVDVYADDVLDGLAAIAHPSNEIK